MTNYKYRITWKRTHKASAAPDAPTFVEVFEDAANDIEQIPSRFRTYRGFATDEVQILQIEKQ
ncbi:MAG: hypothetical protein ABSF63_16040 [Candidatus Bathyarchaeia archaeon]|jgi:hypothetical protein